MILTSPLMVKNLFSDAVIFIYTLLNVGYVISFSNRVYYPSYSGNKVRMPAGEDVLDEKKASVLKGRLDSWVENKCYLQDDAIEDVVSALGTDLDFFRQYFRLRMPSDFFCFDDSPDYNLFTATWSGELELEGYYEGSAASRPVSKLNRLK